MHYTCGGVSLRTIINIDIFVEYLNTLRIFYEKETF